MASTWPPVKSNTAVNVSKLVAKLLHHDTVLLDLLGELMDCHCLIDRSSIASGNILVIHGDPRKVADVIHKVVDETDVKADENDKEVLTVLDSFKERFRAQFDTDFEQDNSTFKAAFHRKISDEVKPSILSLTNKDGRLPLSSHQLSYLHCHLDHLREQVHTSWPESAVIINVQNEAKGQGALVVSSKRHDFQGVIHFLHLFMANIKTSSKELDASRALFLSGVKGQRDVTRLQKEHQCQISVILPGHQVLVRAESPTGHRLFLCEGNMAATDCNMLVLPFSENQRGWTATQKRVLDRGLLTTKTELYTNWIGSPPKKRTLILRCPTPEAGETVMLVHVSDPTGGPSSGAEALTQELAQELSEGLARRISEPRGEFIAVPVAMSTRQSLSDNLEFILPVIQDYLAKEVISATVVLYLDKLSVSEKQKLVETLEKRINQNWKVQTDGAAVYEDNFSSPNLVVAGKMQDIATTFSKLQSLDVPSDIQKRACLLESMNKPRQVRRSPTQESEADAKENKDIDKEDDVRTVCVDGLTADDGELCQMYFQNNEQSGGGQLAQKTVVWDDDTQCWMITFEQRDVAARVASRQHTINGQPVDVKLVYTPRVSYPDKLLFHNVSESISRDYLTLCLERITGQEVTDLLYADKAGDVLVVLDEEPDFTQVQEMCRQKQLEGQELWVSRVPVSNCILLENLSEATSEDTVMYYFSNKRSGGGPVEKVVFQSEQRKCLVFFYNHEVIENILGKTHALDGSQLQVRLYTECLGPSGGRRDASPFTLPSRVEFKNVDKYKMVFIRQSAALQQGLVELLTDLHAKLISADNLLSVECTLTTAVPHASQLAASWTKDVQDAVNSVINMVVVLHQEVMQDVWAETEKAVSAIKPTSQDSALILVLAENRKFVVVGLKNMADDLMKQVKQIVTQKEEEAERKKQEVTETRKLKPFQLHLLTDMSFQSEVAKRHPALKIAICLEKEEISYQGLLRDVREAQVEMYELLMAVRSKKLTMSNLQKTILSAKEGRDYVVHKFHVDKLVAVWDVDRQGEVTVYSCSDSDLAKAIQIMQKSVVQHQQILEPEITELLMSSQWTEFVSKLSGDHSGVLKISHVKNDHQLLLAGIDSIMSGVIDKTEKFLKENTISMLHCHFFPSRQFFVANYWWARVISISNNLRAYKIEVTLVESGHQFHIRGTQAGLETMTKNLKQLGSEVKCHIQTLVDQSQVKFLLSPNCKRDLEKLGRSTQCVFSLKEEPVDLLQSMLIPNDFHERSLLLNIGSDICTVSDSIPSNLRSKLKAGARSRGTFTIPTADLHSLEKSDFSPIQNLIKTENDGRKCSVPLENQMASVIEGIKVIGFVPAGSREGGVPTVLENKNPMVKRDVPKSKENQQSPFLEKNVSKLRESKENTLIEREIDSLEYEALKYLLDDSFTCCATKTSGKGGRVTVSVPMTGDICDKIDSLRQETVPLDESDLSKLENPINTRSEGVEAFVKVFQKERKVVIFCFDYSNMNKAKHLLQIKTGKIKRRVARKFVEGSSSSSSQQLSTHTHSKPVDRIELNTESGIKVSVYKVDITKLPVDAIVNAANTEIPRFSNIIPLAGFGGPSLTQTYNSPVVEEAKLFVYGESAESIRQAIRHFGDLVKDKFTRKEIVDEIIPNMNEDELRKIKTAGQSHNVEVKIQPFAGRIVIDGMHADVFDAATEINKLIREADRYRQQAQQASMLANMVQWCFLEVTPEGTEQKEYKEHENQIIEMAYQRKKKIATIKDSSGIEYVIDFDSMKEYPKHDPDDSVAVIRKDKMKESSSGVLPENWTIQPDKENLKLVKLSPQNSEYQDVEKNFRSTLGRLAVTVLSIERIENPTQYRQYMAKKAHLEKQNTGIQNEKMLWHGTASDALSNINHYGFNRSYCGKNATVYGQGVYFAVNSQYSASPTYSPPDPSTGQRYMYQCKVLVGHPVAGNNTMRFLPARSGPIQYDSSTDNPQKPSLYAIFNDTQAYPEYLITFR